MGGSSWNFSTPVQSPLVIDTWMLKWLARYSFCVLASAELLLWRRSCSVSCCPLGASCFDLGAVKCVCAAAIGSVPPVLGLCCFPPHSQTVALPYGPLLSSSFNEQFPSWPQVLRVAELFTAVSGAQTPLFPESPLLLPAAEPAPIFFKAEETQTLCMIITVLASVSHISALHPSGVFLVLVAYLALSQGSMRQVFKV